MYILIVFYRLPRQRLITVFASSNLSEGVEYFREEKHSERYPSEG
jgi:hypothetical protein